MYNSALRSWIITQINEWKVHVKRVELNTSNFGVYCRSNWINTNFHIAQYFASTWFRILISIYQSHNWQTATADKDDENMLSPISHPSNSVVSIKRICFFSQTLSCLVLSKLKWRKFYKKHDASTMIFNMRRHLNLNCFLKKW